MSNNKLLRVSQLDAVHLNDELTKIFLNQFQICLQYLPPGMYINYQKEINHFVKLLLSSYSLFNHDSTFGQKMLVIKYSNVSFVKKILYILLSTSDYAKDMIEDMDRNHSLFNCSKYLISVVKFFSFINLCLFIKYGKYPLVIERILGLEQVYAKDFVQRQYGAKYLTRELLWNGLIEVLVYILPLVNYKKVIRISKKFSPFHKKSLGLQSDKNINFDINTKCACCGELPILPHHMNCPHVFCYLCLKGNLKVDTSYECPICGHSNSKEICERIVM